MPTRGRRSRRRSRNWPPTRFRSRRCAWTSIRSPCYDTRRCAQIGVVSPEALCYSTHSMTHAHDGGDHAHRKSTRSLNLSLVITGSLFLLELAGGFLTNSLALLADAGHMLTDLAALA